MRSAHRGRHLTRRLRHRFNVDFAAYKGMAGHLDGLLGSLLRMLCIGFEFDHLTHRSIYV